MSGIGPTVGPLRAESSALRRLIAGEAPERVSPRWPAFGDVVVVDGCHLREVTFLAEADDPSHEVMVHVNGVTDAHRTDIRPALLQRVPGTRLHALTYLLPVDLTASYRFVSAPDLPRDAGATREGWLRIHEAGRPDPRNPIELPNPLGHRSSVLVLPDARLHPAWDPSTPRRIPYHRTSLPMPDGHALTLLQAASDERAPGARLVVCFDAERWEALDVHAALERRTGPAHTVVLVPSGTPGRRSVLLPHPERIIEHLELDVLPAVHRAGVVVEAEETVVAGQSYGGLAAAAIGVLRPDLAATAVVQSGSFHFSPGQVSRPPTGQRGELLARLETEGFPNADDRRFIVQVGTEEGDMVAGSAEFAGRTRRLGARTSFATVAGGHDYAWWRSGIFDALDDV